MRITGPGGTITVDADAAGNFSVSGLEAGDYDVIGVWSSSDHTATQAVKFGTVSVTQNSTVSFSFPG